MRRSNPVIALLALSLLLRAAGSSPAQVSSPVDRLQITADSVATWTHDQASVVQTDGPTVIELDHSRLSADAAVIWIQPAPDAGFEEQDARIALLGHVTLKDVQTTRSSDQLLVTVQVRGTVSLAAAHRTLQPLQDSDTYRRALAMLSGTPATAPAPAAEVPWLMNPEPAAPTSAPATRPAKPIQPLAFSADNINFVKTPDGAIAVVLAGSVKLVQRRPMDQTLELQADQAVLFTPLTDLRQLDRNGRITRVEDAVSGAYLDGDVRIDLTPPKGPNHGEQRLAAHTVYYDFRTDRAILTAAVLHTLEPKLQLPIIIRAQVLRQLSLGEYRAEKVKLTTSSFFTPTYSVGMSKAYVRQTDTPDDPEGVVTDFQGHDMTIDISGLPLFYLPYAAGSFSEHGALNRNIQVGTYQRFGTGVQTEWGLYETLGKLPPPLNDSTYELDDFSGRGPAGGIGGKYAGGFITDSTREPWTFQGDYQAYVVNDRGLDDLGNGRTLVTPPQQFRGRVFWEHQHLLPDDWQVQVTAAWISDATFMPEWYQDAFNTTRPQETALYLKHQHDNEALTFLASGQPNNFVTSADQMQNQFEVQRLPQLGYHRIGESLADDNLSFFSGNTVAGLEFHPSSASLADQGFVVGDGPGLPSLGTTGVVTTPVYRGDFRQELDYPVSAGPFRLVPYVLGRFISYSNSPGGTPEQRLLAGAGLRLTTDFWKVDDSVLSDLLDLHRLRHIVEPQLNLFTSAETVRQSDVYIYDQPVDAINAVSAVQLGLDQFWQTQRGGPGRWRSTDVFTLDVEANFFLHKPPNNLLNPVAFRGLYFESMPEASVPRDSLNADATWRVSDTTAVLSDAEYNVDYNRLATASIGLAVQRDTRLGYYLGTRYIDELHSNITTASINYQLTTKYTIALSQSFDFGVSHSVGSSIYVVRHFDRIYAAFSIGYDEVAHQSSIGLSVWPEGLATPTNSTLNPVFSNNNKPP